MTAHTLEGISLDGLSPDQIEEMKKNGIIETVKLENLYIEPDRQREVDMKRAQAYADDWDPRLVGTLHVALDEDGRGEILDGGHRWQGARLAGLEELQAVVYRGLTAAERAYLFLALNSQRKAVDRLTRYQVSVEGGFSPQVEIDRVVTSRGLKVGSNPTSKTIATVAGLEKIEKMGGVEAVGLTIDVLQEAFGGFGGDAWSADIFTGVGVVLVRNPHIERHRLVITLQAQTPRNWQALVANESRGSGGSGGRPMHMARLVTKAYNRGLRATSKKRISI